MVSLCDLLFIHLPGPYRWKSHRMLNTNIAAFDKSVSVKIPERPHTDHSFHFSVVPFSPPEPPKQFFKYPSINMDIFVSRTTYICIFLLAASLEIGIFKTIIHACSHLNIQLGTEEISDLLIDPIRINTCMYPYDVSVFIAHLESSKTVNI